MVTCAFNCSEFFHMRLGVPRRAGRIGKRVRIPRGRATVKIVASESDDAKARRPARTSFAAFERLAQGCSGRRGNSLLGKDPVASLSLPRGRKVGGILSFQLHKSFI